MWTERLLAEMRACLRGTLPERAFIRRDRGDGLFISNAPVFAPELTDVPGFISEKEGNLLRLLPDDSWLRRLEEACHTPPDFFSRSLLRFRGQSPDRANLRLFAQGVKLLEGKPAPTDIAAFDRCLRQRCAEALRGGASPGGLYAAALILAQINTIYKGEQPT